jgi:chromosome segregation protein
VLAIARQLQELQRQRAERAGQAEALRQRIDDMRRAIEQCNLAKQAKEAEASQRDREMATLRDELAVAQSEIQDIQQSLQQAERKETQLQSRMEALQQRQAALEQEVAEHTLLLRQKDEEQRAMESRLTEMRIALGQKEEKVRYLVDRIAGLERDLHDREAEREAAIRGSRDAVQKREAAKLEIQQSQQLIDQLSREKEQVEARTRSLTDQREDLRRRLGESNEHVRALRTRLKELDDEAHQSALKQADLHGKMTNLADRLRDQYQIDLAQRVREQTQDPQLEWDKVEQDIAQLDEQLRRMGSVNLEAIAEQDELEIRERFLLNQREDLEKSQRQLHEIIRKINRTSRDLFEKTFHAVRENFQETFRKLFGGGSADIVLQEGEDILEAGIEIIARPPGKQPRSISLLSGGEKTMTTVALLFAIFQAKPSPFCILDEVDAALDESNIDRFVAMLQEFTKQSQFVIVTHSKRTMAVADVMYGITMQDSGISKKVAVKFEGRQVA